MFSLSYTWFLITSGETHLALCLSLTAVAFEEPKNTDCEKKKSQQHGGVQANGPLQLSSIQNESVKAHLVPS